MDQISTQIGQEASHVNVPDEAALSLNKMTMLDAEFREKHGQLQTLIEQRKAKYATSLFVNVRVCVCLFVHVFACLSLFVFV